MTWVDVTSSQRPSGKIAYPAVHDERAITNNVAQTTSEKTMGSNNNTDRNIAEVKVRNCSEPASDMTTDFHESPKTPSL